MGVVVPCHNYARYLDQCLDSVLDQPGVELDVLVVDDASTDLSFAVATARARRDPRVRVLRHETNRGHIRTYNHGLDEVRGEFVVLLSADDLLAPGALRRACDLMRADPSVGFTYGPVVAFSGTVPPVPAEPPAAETQYVAWRGVDWLARRCRIVTNCVVSPEVVMRRSVYDRVGPYDEHLPHTGDMAMWMRAAAVSDVGHLPGSTAAFYRKHDLNMHVDLFLSGRVDGMLVDLRQRRATVDSVLVGGLLDPRVAERLVDTAHRALAAESLEAAARAYTWGLSLEWPVDELVEFAQVTWPGYRRLPQWRALRRRRALGPRLSHKNPAFVATEMTLRSRRAHRARVQERAGL